MKKGKPECKKELELTEKLESGVSVARVCEEYGAKKQTASDIRKTRYILPNLFQYVTWMLQISQANMKMVYKSSLEDGMCNVFAVLMYDGKN